MESVWNLRLADVRDTTVSDHPFATSGAIALISAVYGCSLLRMALSLSFKKIKGKAKLADAEAILQQLETASKVLSELADRDIRAFQGFLAAFHLPKDNDQKRRLRTATIRTRRIETTRIPLQGGDEIMKIIAMVDQLIPVCVPNLLCDLAAATNMLHSSVLNLAWTVHENARQLPADKMVVLHAAVQQLKKRSKAACGRINNRIAEITAS